MNFIFLCNLYDRIYVVNVFYAIEGNPPTSFIVSGKTSCLVFLINRLKQGLGRGYTLKA